MDGKGSLLFYWEVAIKMNIQPSFSRKFSRFAHMLV